MEKIVKNKKNKKSIGIIGIVAVIPVLIVCGLLIRSRSNSASTPEEDIKIDTLPLAEETLNSFFRFLRDGAVEDAGRLSSEGRLGISSDDSAAADALRSVFSWELSSFENSSEGASCHVTLSYADIIGQAGFWEDELETILSEQVQQASSSEEVYDEELNYLPEVLEGAWDRVIEEQLNHIQEYITSQTVTVRMVKGSDGYSVLLNDELRQLISCLYPGEELQERKELLFAAVPYIRKEYRIEEGALCGYEPEESRFGVIEDSAGLEALLNSAYAKALLNGQNTLLTTETQRVSGTNIRYYLDETILVLIWNEPIGSCMGTFCETVIGDASQFRRKLSEDYYGSINYQVPSELSRQAKAVTASSADLYNHWNRKIGIGVYEGQLLRFDPCCDTCFIDEDGGLIFRTARAFSTETEAQSFIDENHIRFSLNFGPIMLQDGQNVTPASYPYGEFTEDYPRIAFSSLGKLHYLTTTVNCSREYGLASWGCSVWEFAEALLSRGVSNAYALDGGQTGVILLNHRAENPLQYPEGEQIVSDIIYFATAVPNS